MEYLKPHQKEGVDWMVDMEQTTRTNFHEEDMPIGGILADEVGLGKTIQTIGLILSNPMKTLIVTPKSLVPQWIEEFERFAPHHTVTPIQKFCHVEYEDDNRTYIMSSSDLNKSNSAVGGHIVHGIKWGRVVIDEAHSIKNKKSKLHKSMNSIDSFARWCLTATPVMNKMEDFISLLAFIGISQYVCQGFKDDVVKTFIKRRTKIDVRGQDASLDLPDLHIEICRIPFSCDEEKKLYSEVYADTKEQLRKKGTTNAIEILEMLLRVRQVCAFPQCYVDGMKRKLKLTNMADWSFESTKITRVTNDILNVKDQKSIIFCQFRKEMTAYQTMLEEYGVRTTKIDGSMSTEERTNSIDKFKSTLQNAGANVIIIQIQTGGQGYNLQIAQNVFITCPTWNPCIEYQAIGRAHRTGQVNDVIVKKYIISDVNDTETVFIEENMLTIHDKKRKIMASALNDDRLLNDGAKYPKSMPLTSHDLKKIFKG